MIISFQQKPESENKRKRRNWHWELKGLWSMDVALISIVIKELGTNHKNPEKEMGKLEIRGWIEIIHPTATLESGRISGRVRETWGDLLSLKPQRKITRVSWSKCRQCGDRDETINHIISECSKIAEKEYKARLEWVGKVIHWEMCKKLKFDHTNKWYMHNLAPVLENDIHKLLWDFDIQTDHLIPARRPDLIVINKKENLQNCQLCWYSKVDNLWRSSWPQNKTERKWKG